MNELFSNEINVLTYNTYIKTNPIVPVELPTATISLGNLRGSLVLSNTQLTVTPTLKPGVYEVYVPHTLLSGYRYASINFNFNLPVYGPGTKSDLYSIGQRLVTFEEWAQFAGKDITDDAYIDEHSKEDYQKYSATETIVRKVIEAYCSQPFNYWIGSLTLYAPKSFIRLPQHMEKLYSVGSGEEVPIQIMESYESSLYNLSDSGYSVSTNTVYKTPSPIYQSPENNIYYHVTGEWGWTSVPEAVKRAALQLIEYYSSDAIQTRYRFLVSSSGGGNASQYSMSFNSFRNSTGNPVADDILGPYRIFQVNAV